MRKIACVVLLLVPLLLWATVAGASAKKEVYRLGIGRYEVGEDILPGTYTVEAHEKNTFAAKVTVGNNLNAYGEPMGDANDYVRFYLAPANNAEIKTEKTVDIYNITLEDGQSIYVHTDDVIFRLNGAYAQTASTDKASTDKSENPAEQASSAKPSLYDNCEKLSPSTKKAELIPTERYVVDLEDPTQYEWSSSNSDVVEIFDNGTFVSVNSGKATITGKPKDGSKDKIKISLVVNIPYVSSKNIVIDSPEGAELITYLGGGIIMTNYTGDDCFEVEDEGGFFVERMRILPVKEGKGAIVYEINFRKTIKVNITVKKSALMSEEERAELVEKAGENAQVATVTKGVNIRADATADSAKVGYANAGEELIVTQAFYAPKWHQILYDGELCYVSAKYVDIGK